MANHSRWLLAMKRLREIILIILASPLMLVLGLHVGGLAYCQRKR